ncbi:PQQ-binding-like beta-propeller repeat protein [Paenibacillus sp. YPG26]|uniref:outer membrane protein assembly factor BamB family protein n=1 Tax=Paenibacillus sp. YPG26 TaxID=2878915 RepID=UPI00203C4D16|nr:PQQ-binding-like beta-propeller repeat protein [Paenibacillus sp. YPG26]USB31976.1 PQQ-binding-like beta-propeller repeat protein [Paenibacillus sp. YPG26]
MMNKLAKFTSSAVLVLLAAGATIPGGEPAKVSAEKAAVSFTQWTEPSTHEFITPAWTAPLSATPLEVGQMPESRVAAGEGKVFAVDKGRLIARDVFTGRQTWTFGSSLSPYIEYNQGTLYGTYEDGRAYALTAKGALKWVSARTVAKAERLVPIQDTLYIVRGIDIFAFDAGNGALRWEHHDTSAAAGSKELTVQDGVVFRTYTGVSNFAVTLKAFDAATGEKLWEKSQQHLPLQVKGGSVYSVYEPNLFEKPNAELTLKVFDLRTGGEKAGYLYQWSDNPASYMHSYTTKAMIEGNYLYAFNSHEWVQFDLTKYSGKSDQPERRMMGPGRNILNPLMKVYRDRIFYLEGSEQSYFTLKSVHLPDQHTVNYRYDNPAAQIDIHGNGIYIGQTDGSFRAFDLATGKEAFAIQSGARNYRPTEFEQGMAIIQADHKLIGIAVPANLQ